MSDDTQPEPAARGKQARPKKLSREERLAAALRDNLKKRKAQAREKSRKGGG